MTRKIAVTFDYRTPEDDQANTRRLQPWGVVCWRGRWYVVGHDLDRRAARCFRLSRVVGTVRRSGRPGSYEPPDMTITAVEPSASMRAQHKPHLSAAIDAVAEDLPFQDAHRGYSPFQKF